MNKKIKLMPCPYCNGKAFIEVWSDGTPFINARHNKKCRMKPNTWLLSNNSINKQIKAWNMRGEE